MIVFETEDAFVMTAQHDHGRIAGELASSWKEEHLGFPGSREELVYAAFQHDQGWIRLDAAPFWNDHAAAPYTFKDFPLSPRFVFYKLGIDEVEKVHPYAALLCSSMYSQLVERSRGEHAGDMQVINEYLADEEQRRARLYQSLGGIDVWHDRLQSDLQRLMFCDELSLFICMQSPGTAASEYEWFADGLSTAGLGHGMIRAEWISEISVGLSFNPLEHNARVTHLYRTVPKRSIREQGLAEAYRLAPVQQRTLSIERLSGERSLY
ncbi:DUF3891 family protein [Paenibacillus medicaginis]|uniref:DUF3891 family protein n=1 Tax=Paenibacillus medicaginis TaxID=1470560 RepID=A0ABV5C3U2_9BACL